jgi:hypothetical protein
MDMRFGIWNVRNLYWAGSLMRVLREISWTIEREGGVVWTGLIWFRVETSGGLL